MGQLKQKHEEMMSHPETLTEMTEYAASLKAATAIEKTI
jgi:hypothetical protein